MANVIEMPKLSDTMTVGTLVKWLKKEGDSVKTGDMLAEVETDKATMELESFFDGTLLRIFAAEGSQAEIGAPLCAIGKPGETVDVPAAAPKPAGGGQRTEDGGQETGDRGQGKTEPSTPRVPGKPGLPRVDSGQSTMDSGKPTGDRERKSSAVSSQLPPGPAAGRLKISPLARKLAVEKKIDPAGLTGSGPGGRIVRADILAAETDPRTQSAIRHPQSAIRTGPIQDERSVPVSNMRGAIARRLVESKTQLPHFFVEIEIDAAPLLSLREQLNHGLEGEGVKLSVNDFILKGSAEALRRVPAVNASWEGPSAPSTGSHLRQGYGGHAGQAQIRYFSAAHVAFAVAIDDGLITPVVRDAHLKSIFQISTEAKSLGKLARDKKLKPDQFTGGTFCVSNLGMMGIPRFSAIINPPNAAILAVGTTVAKPVVKNNQIVIGQTMVLTLSCDHRVVDGAVGAQFLNALKQLLEAPALLLV